MELKLNIYENKKVIKTYEEDSYDLMFGTIEDLLNALNLDQVNTENDIELLDLAVNVIKNGFGLIKPLLKDIFDGLTDDEIKHTKVSEIASVLVNVVKFAIIEMGKGASGKN